jgi:hypothetical protein
MCINCQEYAVVMGNAGDAPEMIELAFMADSVL